MNNTEQDAAKPAEVANAREWVRHLANYRDPNVAQSIFEIAATAVPFLALWALAWWALSISYWLALALAVLNGVFVVRMWRR